MYKTVFIFLFVFCTHSIIAQNNKWHIGIGGAVTVFGKKDAAFIGDRAMFQAPRLNLTLPLNEKLSVDGAVSFNSFDIGFIKNAVKYFSIDGSLRYNFTELFNNLNPYVFAGGSLVDSERKMTPTLNVGTGATYWLSNSFGLNTQLYYKHSFEGYESMRSHIQVTGGIVFSFGRINRRASFKTSRASRAGCYYDQIK